MLRAEAAAADPTRVRCSGCFETIGKASLDAVPVAKLYGNKTPSGLKKREAARLGQAIIGIRTAPGCPTEVQAAEPGRGRQEAFHTGRMRGRHYQTKGGHCVSRHGREVQVGQSGARGELRDAGQAWTESWVGDRDRRGDQGGPFPTYQRELAFLLRAGESMQT